VRIVPAHDYADEDGLAVVNELKARLGNQMDIVTERVSSIPRTRSGKLRAVLNQSRTARIDL
jgi:hypothetical protein